MYIASDVCVCVCRGTCILRPTCVCVCAEVYIYIASNVCVCVSRRSSGRRAFKYQVFFVSQVGWQSNILFIGIKYGSQIVFATHTHARTHTTPHARAACARARSLSHKCTHSYTRVAVSNACDTWQAQKQLPKPPAQVGDRYPATDTAPTPAAAPASQDSPPAAGVPQKSPTDNRTSPTNNKRALRRALSTVEGPHERAPPLRRVWKSRRVDRY